MERNNHNTYEVEAAKLAKLRFDICSLHESNRKRLLLYELEIAAQKLEEGNAEYAKQFRKHLGPVVRRIRFREAFTADDKRSNIKSVLLGIVCYSLIVFVIGICAVIVNIYQRDPQDELIVFVKNIGLLPVFITVSDLGIKPILYLWGITGGAGAVVSIVKRFDEIGQREASFWSLFAQGLFNPIVGSLAAVVVCTFVKAGLLNILSAVPLLVISFFSGFSERLLEKVGTLVLPKTKE